MKQKKSICWAFAGLACALGLIFAAVRQGEQDFPAKSPSTISHAEWLWLTENPQALVVASGPDLPPFLHQNQHGGKTGLLHDYLTILAKRLGCQFYHVSYNSREELDTLLREKKVALVLDLQKGHGRSDLLEAPVLATAPAGIYIRKNHRAALSAYTLQNMRGLRTAISKNSSMLPYLRTYYPDIPLRPVTNDLSALTQLAAGFVDCAIVNTRSAEYYIRELNLPELIQVGTAGPALQLLFGIRKDLAPLHSLVHSTLQSISEEQHEALAARRIPLPWWDSKNVRQGLLLAACVFGALLALVAIFYLWTRSLRYQVRQKSAQLREELELRKHMESQLLHSAKAEAMGTLASGVYHDLNNFMTVIAGYAELNCSGKVSNTREYSANSQKIYRASQQAHAVLRKLLGYIRRDTEQATLLPVHTAITNCLHFLEGLLPEYITFQQHGSEDSAVLTSVDNPLVMQLIINLCSNAADAMQGRGIIQVSTHLLRADQAEPALPHFLTQGTWILPCPSHGSVAVSVHDKGDGISPADLQKIFEPLYTTKPVSKGTGMGLAIVKEILRRAHGGLHVYSSPSGSVFTLCLPLVQEQGTQPAPPRVLHETAPESCPWDMLILDFDAPRLRHVGGYYQKWGYTPLLVDSAQALGQILPRLHTGALKAVLIQASATAMAKDSSSTDLASSLRALDPTLPIILCTDAPLGKGYCGINEVIPAPANVRVLASLVRHFR